MQYETTKKPTTIGNSRGFIIPQSEFKLANKEYKIRVYEVWEDD